MAKLLVNYGKSPFYSWVNQLFQWLFSIAMLLYQRVIVWINKPPGITVYEKSGGYP
jgi:hypothetical protein